MQQHKISAAESGAVLQCSARIRTDAAFPEVVPICDETQHSRFSVLGGSVLSDYWGKILTFNSIKTPVNEME